MNTKYNYNKKGKNFYLKKYICANIAFTFSLSFPYL